MNFVGASTGDEKGSGRDSALKRQRVRLWGKQTSPRGVLKDWLLFTARGSVYLVADTCLPETENYHSNVSKYMFTCTYLVNIVFIYINSVISI